MPEESVLAKTKELFPDEAFREMVEAGVFYGRKKNRVNPKMRPYILTRRGDIEIINLTKTAYGLDRAAAFLREKTKENAMVLLVATQPHAEEIKNLAIEFNFPYVVKRWIGGTLTNFKIISLRVEHFKKLKSDLASGVFGSYTKKERARVETEIKKLEELIGGLENMSRRPDLVLIIDSHPHETAVREARRLRIPIVAFSNIDSDPDQVDYLVPGNASSRKSVNWFLGKVREAIKEGEQARLTSVPLAEDVPPTLDSGKEAGEKNILEFVKDESR